MGAGEGFVQFVEGAFGDRNALAVGGGDERGLAAATDWLAHRAPYLWTYGKGEYRLADAETEVRRFLQARKAPGQVALALTKLGSWMDRMADDPPRTGGGGVGGGGSPGGDRGVGRVPCPGSVPRRRQSRSTHGPPGLGWGIRFSPRTGRSPGRWMRSEQLLEAEVYPNVRPGAPADIESQGERAS